MPSRRSSFPHIALKPYAGDDDLQILQAGGEGSVAQIKSVGSTSDDYMMKVMSAQMQFGCDAIDATGEYTGNLAGTQIYDTHMESLHQLKGQIAFQGHALPDDAIGLVNLETELGSGGSDDQSYVDVKFLLGIGRGSGTGTEKRYIKFRMVIESIGIDWNIDRPSVAVSIRGRLSDQYGGSGGPLQESTS